MSVPVLFAPNQHGDLWPAPGIYFIEIVLAGLAGFASRVMDTGGAVFPLGSGRISPGAVTWAAAGMLLAFVVLGMFSIGPLLFPAMLAFGAAAALGDRRQGRALLPHLGLALAAALVQAGIIALVLVLGKG
ncbi:MAG TPA: hypothetical protein VF813_02010 [Anaerolineaceae bacterium]